jgi:hypothetical protein
VGLAGFAAVFGNDARRLRILDDTGAARYQIERVSGGPMDMESPLITQPRARRAKRAGKETTMKCTKAIRHKDGTIDVCTRNATHERASLFRFGRWHPVCCQHAKYWDKGGIETRKLKGNHDGR